MRAREFERQVAELLKATVDGLSHQEQVNLLRASADAFLADRSLAQFSARFAPFVPGRRPDDEREHAGLGSSEDVGLIHRGRAEGHPLKFLIQCLCAGDPVPGFPPASRVTATIEVLNLAGQTLGTLDGWDRRDVGAWLKTWDSNGPPRAIVLELDTHQVFGNAPAAVGPRYLRFGALFHQRFRIHFDVRIGEAWIAGDEHLFEIHDKENCGSLYRRLLDVLLPHDTRLQAERRGIPDGVSIRAHPWYPVLTIGLQKERLYMNAIVGDLDQQKRMLTNPGWLLRVGLFLELLTCLGIAEATKDEIDILTPEERECLETSTELAQIRRRIGVAAWRKAWALRKIAFTKAGEAGQTGTMNLLRKRNATLGFLRAHHEDLKHAIELAGPNLYNAQETWQRVFRDAERAVLQTNQDAFPELAELPDVAREFALWHEEGRFAGMQFLPRQLTEMFGDRGGLFPSACRQYRASMNHVAASAAARGLMNYTGSECIPASASLLEAHLSHDAPRLARLQRRDGYAASLEIHHEERELSRVDRETAIEVLRRVDVFSVLSAEEIGALAADVRPIDLGPLERILVQGRPGTSLFILQDGVLEVIERVGDVERRLAVLHPPAVVGELAFLLNEERSATVRAVDGAVVLEIGARQLRPLVQTRPAVLDALAALVEERRRLNREPAMADGLLDRLRRAILGA